MNEVKRIYEMSIMKVTDKKNCSIKIIAMLIKIGKKRLQKSKIKLPNQ